MRIRREVHAPLLLLLLALWCAQAQYQIAQSCARDDFRCNDGKCIDSSRRCDRVVDCPSQEDEQNCECRADEIRCKNDGSCIEARKRCDGINHCSDNSDEVDCANGYFKCRTGKFISGELRCNRHYDCPPGDYSDEHNCPCGDGDFRCDNGFCIPANKHCDRTHDCQDGSDERNCTYGTVCMAYQYKCTSGKCVEADAICNGTAECEDGSDETSCPCKRDEFECRDESCISLALRCNGQKDCYPHGEDEFNCGAPRCPPDSFTCDPDSSRLCAKRCDGRVECDKGEDEDNCDDCNHLCDGRCLEDSLICNGVPDCRDGSDELQCDHCDGPSDFRCRNGECLNIAQHCNGVEECADYSDEQNCNDTMIPAPVGCTATEFQCRQTRNCINNYFVCDGHPDCQDNSDEENCSCDQDKWKCASGQCIDGSAYCDGTSDCSDNSDEVDCPTSRPWPPPVTYPPYLPPYQPTTTSRPIYTTTSFPYRPYPPSDNQDSQSPVALKLMTYPEAQKTRYGINHGGDVVFQCRDEGPQRAAVRWVREGGRPLKPGSSDKKGRLEMYKVTPSDSGNYICQAVRYLQYPGSELRVELVVDATPIAPIQPFPACAPYQATCANGQCISKTEVCNGKIDCSDGSDEETCYQNGMCEPDQYQCANRKCVLKTWICDSDDDCGDGSDEQNCGAHDPYQFCHPVEFKCLKEEQCVPKSFHCDGQTDCQDGSDEIGCAPVHVTKPPKPTNVKLNPGDNLTLTCEAVGVPIPLISWRLNWGHVPPKCRSTSENGVGVLTCANMQPGESGAYSCEAMNNKGTTFATPDAIVHVERTEVCPSGFFNSEAESQNECIRCFCFGESTTCHSADLFTYNMPTPLGEGGTMLLGVKQSYNGEIQIDSQPITEQYYYLPLRNGATVTKLAIAYGSNDAHPYLTLPETYNGNQLTSYGGHIKYKLSPHSPRYGSNDNLPDIIIKGKYESLVHQHRSDSSRATLVNARLTPEYWQKLTPRGPVPATREDIMMALDDIEMILLRADQNNAGVNITNFVMQSANHIDLGLGAANLVEECNCREGYEGLSCQKCASGYIRERSGPWLGHCVKEQRPCPPGMYGDPSSGYGCRPCNCPLTNSENQFARTCSIGPDGGVICDCAPGYGGRNCEYCEAGYTGNPMIHGDSCKPKPTTNCNAVGTVRSPMPDECQCKDNVQGRFCDQCKGDAFYLSEDFRHGCALCFCSGVSQQCMSSNMRRRTTTVRFNTPQIVNQVRIYNSAPLGPADAVKYNAPVETDLKPRLLGGEVALSEFDRSRHTIYYWSLPASFAGDKVTSYGGNLRYTLRHIPLPGGQSSKNNAADIQLISDNRLTFHYFGNFAPNNDGTLNASVQFLEKGWQRPDGKEISREHFLLALADVKAILIKATYTTNTQLASLDTASIETAEPNGDGPQALHVEQCVCPTGYVGTSCEDCAPGYTRSSSGLYLEHCDVCDCNGHSNMCHPETGVCFDCNDNTDGENCELCKPGYEKNAYGSCVPGYATTSTPRCNCDPRGEAGPCDSGYCQCKQNVEGEFCDRCRQGTFGLDASNPLGCLPCYCSGVTSECHEASQYSRIPIAAPIFGDNYGGYSLTNLNADRVINDQFVPDPNESELMYMFSYPPNEELYWSLPVFPGNRVLSYGGILQLTQKFESGGYSEASTRGTDVVLVGDTTSLYWSNPVAFSSGQSMSYQVPLQESGWFILNTATPATRNDFMGVLKDLKRVLVRATLSNNIISTAIADVSMDTAAQSYLAQSPAAKGVEVCMCREGHTGTSCETCTSAYYKDAYGNCMPCSCNGHDCELTRFNTVQCSCRPPYTGPDCSQLVGDEQTAVTNTTRPPPPPESTVYVRITNPTIKIQEVGGSVNFTCQAQSRMTNSRLPVTWTKVDGNLPQGRSQVDLNTGVLLITNLQLSDSGRYVCQTSDGYSTGQAIATLTVPSNEMSLPTATILPAINEYSEGDRIQLECRVTGNPAPRITWQRSSRLPLPLMGESFEAFFVIESAREEDSGEYRCIASNEVGSSDSIALVKIRPRISWPNRERLTISPNAPSVSEGQSTRVVCTGTAKVPAGSINWVRQDGSELLPNVRSDNGVLHIDYARPENQGIYICQSTSSDVTPVPVVVNVVLLGPAADPSNITVAADHLKIPTGGSGTVDCNPLGFPVPLIRWKKYQSEFGPGTSQRENTLIISNAQDDDQGYYICEGTVNGDSIANIYVYVEIEKREPPDVKIWPEGEQAVALGSQFEFHCRVLAGVPEPDVMWGRSGGRPLSTYTELQAPHVLRFQSIDVNDEGEYTCSATNVAGTASASAVLKVRSPPQIIITPSNYIQAVQGDTVLVECRANGYPEPLVSIRSSRDMNEVVQQTAGIAVLRIPSVSDRHGGDYVCTATSAAGTIDEQFIITVERGDGGFLGGEGSGEGEFGQEQPSPNNNEPRNLIAFEGEDRTIECEAPENFIVEWRRVGTPLQRNAIQRGSTLYIRNASRSDSGQYECNLINRDNNEVQQAAYTSLQIVAAPRITLRPKTQTVHPGQSPTVECVVDGDEIIDITWRPVNRPQSPRLEIRASTLIFHQIEVEDAGKYECFARNRYANASAVAEVIVNGIECSDTKFRCLDDTGCIEDRLRCDGYADCQDMSDEDKCLLRDASLSETPLDYDPTLDGPRDEAPSLVSIDQPRRQFRVGENVEVLCRANGERGIRVTWERYGSNQQRQYVETRDYGDGSMLVVPGIQEQDAGIYRCTGRDSYDRKSFEDFNLEVQPVSSVPAYPVGNNQDVVYTARLGKQVDLPCNHNLEQPVMIEWRREYSPLPPEVRINEPNIHLEHVTEADAGTYVCRVSNSRAAIEARAILRVEGVVPRFDRGSWLALPTLKDAYRQFDIEISFKPNDYNGLILYTSENQGRTGDFLALRLAEGVPQFMLETGNGLVTVVGDRPLQLNTWHTIRLSRTNSKVIMDVDNTGPFTTEATGQWDILDLHQPLYIGGVPDFAQLPNQLADTPGFFGCVSMLILGREEKNVIVDSIEQHNIRDCDSCSPNLCLNNGVCQEARNERGYMCLCADGFAGLNCDRTGEACRPGLCGPGKCADTADGYQCACPVTFTGKNCDVKQSIEYPAFTGSAYLAIKAPQATRFFRMSMKIKATAPVTDGIIMYCAESKRGLNGFTSLAVHDGKLEFRYDLGDGSTPVVLTANRTLPANEWTDVHIALVGATVSLKTNLIYTFEGKLESKKVLHLDRMLMFVGGVDDTYILNNNTGVTGGFNGCIKDVMVYGKAVDIVNSSIDSANVKECSNYDRGDIPEIESVCSHCRNGGYCSSPESTACTCPYGYTGLYCEARVRTPARRPQDPCAAQPCRHGGTCKLDTTTRMNYTCDCPMHYAGANCQMPLELLQSVGFNGNGYLELPAALLRYDNIMSEPVIFALAFHTTNDGVLLYQREAATPANVGDYILLRVEQGLLVLDWDFGSGLSSMTINDIFVTDGERHEIFAKIHSDNTILLSVDRDHIETKTTTGLSNVMNADSNVYIGGIPERFNVQRYPGFNGCIEQVELMDNRGLNLGEIAVVGLNPQRCRDSRSTDYTTR